MPRRPAPRAQIPRYQDPPLQAGAPVEVRLIGHPDDVRRLAAAMQASAGLAAGSAAFRPSHHGPALRGYLSVTVPLEKP